MKMTYTYYNWIVVKALVILMVSCTDDAIEFDSQQISDGEITVIMTTEDGKSLLKEFPGKFKFTTDNLNIEQVLTIDEEIKGQVIDGFGAALTGSSAFLLNGNTEALNSLFGPEELALTALRLTIGASDFNKNESFTYNDLGEGSVQDLELTGFSIEQDKTDENPIIPVTKEILKINPMIQIMSAPWSAPAWMKTSGILNGGSLNNQYFDVYADYLIKYLNAYNNEGITIDLISVQNEPLNENSNYPTMKMDAESQAELIGSHLGPKLQNSFPQTKIVAYDHNFTEPENPDFAIEVLTDDKVKNYTNAVGFHAYNGSPQDMMLLNEKVPDAEIYFTEQSGIQNEGTTFGSELNFFMRNVFIGPMRRGAKAVYLWNLALNENFGPTNGGCTNCRGVLQITSGGTLFKNYEYYMLGHFSKYVKPGAVVIQSNDPGDTFENIAFQNPDGSKVLILYSTLDTTDVQDIEVKVGNKKFKASLPRRALLTLLWD